MRGGRQVWVTGIGLVSSMGEGLADHQHGLSDQTSMVRVEENAFAPYPVHPLGAVDFSRHIPKKTDQRQMEVWQRIGVYAAGLALEDANIAGDATLLDKTHLVVAAGNGERDCDLDMRILATLETADNPGVTLNEALLSGLRPTLYLGELSNLLAGNISIVHKVTGSSRTLKGEEISGVSAVENAYRRITAGQGDLFLVGGALNAEREDLLLGYELGGNLWSRAYRTVWDRAAQGGGFVLGSVGAFLVLEAQDHAEARGRKPYARLTGVVTDRSRREPGDAARTMTSLLDRLDVEPGPFGVLSGASGVEPVTSEERRFLSDLASRGIEAAVRAYGSRLGHSVEANFPAGLALGALALHEQTYFPPFDVTGFEQPLSGRLERVLVTGLGHWRGEGLALLDRAS